MLHRLPALSGADDTDARNSAEFPSDTGENFLAFQPMSSLRFVRPVFAAVALACSAPVYPAPLSASEPEVPDLDYYFPGGADHDPEAPTPQSVLGWPFAAWHLHHHELVAYLHALADWSDRIAVIDYARSHGRRPLFALAITSPANQTKLEEIRLAHLARLEAAASDGAEGGDGAETKDVEAASADPLVLWMGYGVHGNEPSASQAGVLLAYHLAASRDAEVAEFLENAVVLLDPCLNPDGMERFASWTNAHRGRIPSVHRSDREHREAWPSGRSNYYWFDLNRDWLPAVHPESQGRLRLYGQWMPHVVTDYHEMGNVNRTYFFQPGIPEMVHPLTPEENQKLTGLIARRHSKALDAIGSLYYSRESFDDFYIGKGSTYPDLCGSVGILFEQASSRGFHQDTEHGRLTFPFTIRNQVATSLSTLAAAAELRSELSAHLVGFQREGVERGAASPVQAHLLSAPGDPQRLHAFRQLLDRHGIRHAALREPLAAGGHRFTPANSLVVPARQARQPLLTAMLETRTEFVSPIFYDVSAWHLPSAFGLIQADLPDMPDAEPVEAGDVVPPIGRLDAPESPVAYLLPWEPLSAPAALWRLCEEGVRTWVAQRPIATGEEDGKARWPHGTLVVPVSVQEKQGPGDLRRLMEEIAAEHGIRVRGVGTGLGIGGIDLGSPSLAPVPAPRVLLLVGSGVSSAVAGDIWHHFDQVWGAPLTMAEPSQVNGSLLAGFTTLLLADATFSGLPAAARSAIESWVSRGGCLVAIGSSVSSLASQKWVGADLVKADFGEEKTKDGKAVEKAPARPDAMPYDEVAQRSAQRRLNGIVVHAWFDATHPLAYGYSKHGPHIALIRSGTTFLKPSAGSLADPLRYTDDPLVSGFAAPENVEALKSSVPVLVKASGSGRVVFLSENPVFRGHWHGSSKLLANAIFFGPIVSPSGGGEEDDDDHDDHD